ncbi:MAG: hypothetical protein KIT84_38690 [Labilithrix sp.]|nr:hypothetical protein [Labilithrix sp.]MCW5816989.1 hypothetical protein [Labilithrix sp.]
MIHSSRLVFFASATFGTIALATACADDDPATPSNLDPDSGVIGTADAAPRDSSAAQYDGGAPADASGPAPLVFTMVTIRDVPVSIRIAEAPEAGTNLTIEPAAHGETTVKDGVIRYAPSPGYVGTDEVHGSVVAAGEERSLVIQVNVKDGLGTVVHGTLYTTEVDPDVGWADVDSAGNRVGERTNGELVLVKASGEEVVITPPAGAEYALVRGLAADGTVLAQYLDGDRSQWLSFTWKDGAVLRTCDPGDEGDCSIERMHSGGRIVGTLYDWTTWRGFLWEPDGTRVLLDIDGYQNHFGRAIGVNGEVIGIVDSSSSGYEGPSRCFRGVPAIQTPDDDGGIPTARGFTIMPGPDSNPHAIDCRGVNAAGMIVGSVKATADGENVPRSISDRMRGALWHPTRGFAYVRLPIPRPSESAWRLEQLFGIADNGVIVGWFQDVVPPTPPDEWPTRTTKGVTLRPEAPQDDRVFFEDSTFDHVGGP